MPPVNSQSFVTMKGFATAILVLVGHTDAFTGPWHAARAPCTTRRTAEEPQAALSRRTAVGVAFSAGAVFVSGKRANAAAPVGEGGLPDGARQFDNVVRK